MYTFSEYDNNGQYEVIIGQFSLFSRKKRIFLNFHNFFHSHVNSTRILHRKKSEFMGKAPVTFTDVNQLVLSLTNIFDPPNNVDLLAKIPWTDCLRDESDFSLPGECAAIKFGIHIKISY